MNYVDGINDQKITMLVSDKSLREKVKAIGGKSSFIIRKHIEVKVRDEQHKIEVLQKLMEMGLYFFSGGHD